MNFCDRFLSVISIAGDDHSKQKGRYFHITDALVSGQTKAVLTVGKKEMLVDGRKVLLSQAPYKAGNHIMVPLRQLGAAVVQN